MIPKNIDEITENDLLALVNNAVLEQKTLEYKQALPSNIDSDKKEFLADVSSFANASGGDMIFGIASDNTTGIPKSLEGLALNNVDLVITQLDSAIRDGIDPRIPGVVIRPLKLSTSKTALIIRIQRSWNLPHRVIYKGHDKFYSRSTNGKYPLDVTELRNAFNLSASIADRIRNLRSSRIVKILADDTPVLLSTFPKVVLHVVPVISFSPAQAYNISNIARSPQKLDPIHVGGWSHRYNIDGLLTFSDIRDGRCFSYVQLFKNGIIEAVDSSMLQPWDGRLAIPSSLFERELMRSLSSYLMILNGLGVQLPAYVFLSLLGVRGYFMATGNWRHTVHLIDRDHLLLTEGFLESYDSEPKDILQPCFDSVWNACGFPHSLNYKENGEWEG